MIEVTREQAREWRDHIVTQALMTELTEMMERYVAIMVSRKRPDNDEDNWIRAYVEVAKDVLGFQPPIIDPAKLKEVDDVED